MQEVTVKVWGRTLICSVDAQGIIQTIAEPYRFGPTTKRQLQDNELWSLAQSEVFEKI